MPGRDDDPYRPGPRQPLGVLQLRWVNLVGTGVSLWWFVSERPIEQILVALGALVGGLYTIWLVRIVSDRERRRYQRQVRELRRELAVFREDRDRPPLRRAA